MYILGKSYVISLLANLNARKRSDALVIHGSGNDIGTPPAKLSTLQFSPVNRHTGDGGENSDSMAASFPDHSVVQLNGRHGPITNAYIAEKSGRDVGAKYSNTLYGDLESNHQLTYDA